MKKYDFAISYEIIKREYDSVVLLKKELEHRGYSVCIFQASALTKKMKAGVVVLHSFYSDDNFPFVYYVFGKHQKIFNLRWEEVFIPDLIRDPVDHACDVMHVAWGKQEYLNLLKAGVSQNNIALTGEISLDFLKKYSYLCRNELASKYNLNPEKKWVLFISSFTFGIEDENGMLKYEHAEELRNKGPLGTIINTCLSNRPILLDWFENLVSCRNDIEFIYRPHPEEDGDVRIRTIENRKSNFHVIGDMDVAQWIAVSDKVYNWWSTSAIQVYLLGKGLKLLRPLPIPYGIEYEMFSKMDFITDKESFLNDIDKEETIRKNDELESYYLIDDNYAFKRTADYLEELLKDNKRHNVIDYNTILRQFGMVRCLRNRLFRNFFVDMSLLFENNKVLSKVFKLSYRPAEKKNILTDEIKDKAEAKVDLFLSELEKE
ncbi:MAG: hypothetical protein K6B68_10375 [Eubacterium sp.]|nr:hypothetical protein [Eubacterium sp.]